MFMRFQGMPRLIILAAMIFIIGGCSSLKEPELVSVEISELSRTAGEGLLKITLSYKNPNGRPLTISSVEAEGMINQKVLGNFNLTKPVDIASKAEGPVEIIFNFDPDDIYPGFLSRQFGAIGSKRVRITISGEAEYMKKGEPVPLAIEYSEVYKLPD